MSNIDTLPTEIDPELDTERANEIAAMVTGGAAKKDPHPEPPDVIDGSVTLQAGVVIDGNIHKDAEVRELTGADEEVLERPAIRRNIYRYIKTMLEHCLVSVGGRAPTEEIILGLNDGDAALLVQEIRRATYGDTLDLDARCPFCRHDFSLEYSLAGDVPVRPLKEEERIFTISLKKGGSVELTLPTLGDQLLVEEDHRESNLAERNNALLGRCVRTINGMPATGLSAVRSLPLADLRVITKFISEKQPGPRYVDVEQECPQCASKFPLVLGLEDLFRG